MRLYPEEPRFKKVSARDYYGPDYQDVDYRVPDITNAQKVLGWQPEIPLEEALRRTIAFYLNNEDHELDRLGRFGPV